MSCRIRTNNGFHYVRLVNGIPYVNCGATGVAPPVEEIPINQNFFITLIDEAEPTYVHSSGTQVGPLWETDVASFNASSINQEAVIVFDVGNRPGQIGRAILPNEGVGTDSPVSNVVDTLRPTTGDSVSQNALFTFLKSSIENIWGSNFWSRFAATSYKLIIIVDISGSLKREIIGDGLDAFESFLTSQNVNYQEFGACANERWLSWITEVYNNPTLSEIAVCGCESGVPYCRPSLYDATGNVYGSPNCYVTNSDWSDQSGVYPLYENSSTKVLYTPYDMFNIPYYDIPTIGNSVNNFITSNKIKITVEDPVFGGTYVFDRNVGSVDLSFSPDHQEPIVSYYQSSNYYLNLSESTLNSDLIYYDSSLIGYTLDEYYNNKYIVQLDFIPGQGYDRYPGLLETKIDHNISTSGISLSDAYAFPASFLFTAIKAPSGVDGSYTTSENRFSDLSASGSTSIAFPFVEGEGHRFVAAFTLPSQYRPQNRDYILFDTLPITLNTTTNTLVNDVYEIPSNVEDFDPVGVPNQPVYAFVIGVSGITTVGAVPADPDYFNFNVTGTTNTVKQNNRIIPHSGVAYRVSASGIPYISFEYGNQNAADGQNFTRAGIGRDQMFEQYLTAFFLFPEGVEHYTTYDSRPLFGTKIPSKATIEFIDNCETIYCDLDLSNPQTISTTGIEAYYYTTGGAIECISDRPALSHIVDDYLCDEKIVEPTLADFQNIGVTGYEVYALGVPVYNIQYDENDIPQSTGVYGGIYLSNNRSYDSLADKTYDYLYYPGLLNENQLMVLPYSGAQDPEYVRSFARGFVPTSINYSSTPGLFTGTDPNNDLPIKNWYGNYFDTIELIWKIDEGNSNIAKAVIVPTHRSFHWPVEPTIQVFGPNISPDISGIYTYTKQSPPSNYPVYAKTNDPSWQIHLINNGPSNTPRWNIVNLDEADCLTSYYKLDSFIDVSLKPPVNIDITSYNNLALLDISRWANNVYLPYYSGSWEPSGVYTRYWNDSLRDIYKQIDEDYPL